MLEPTKKTKRANEKPIMSVNNMGDLFDKEETYCEACCELPLKTSDDLLNLSIRYCEEESTNLKEIIISSTKEMELD